MTRLQWQNLVVLSVTEPAAVARILINLKIGREALWTGLALVSILNAALITLSELVSPAESQFPAFLQMPVLLAFLVAGALLITAAAITWIGQWMGGVGQFEDVMVVILWLQALRILVQAISLILLVSAPVLFLLVAIVAAVLGIYIILNFIKEAHGYDSIWKSAGVLLASILGIVLGLSLIGSPFVEAAARV